MDHIMLLSLISLGALALVLQSANKRHRRGLSDDERTLLEREDSRLATWLKHDFPVRLSLLMLGIVSVLVLVSMLAGGIPALKTPDTIIAIFAVMAGGRLSYDLYRLRKVPLSPKAKRAEMKLRAAEVLVEVFFFSTLMHISIGQFEESYQEERKHIEQRLESLGTPTAPNPKR